jgi:hypothetical protein
VIHAGVTTERRSRVVPVRRISPPLFWALLVVEVGVLALVLAWALPQVLPVTTTPLANAAVPRVHAAIAARLSGATNDPIVSVGAVSARTSNLRGLSLGGVTYYYFVEGRTNHDPFSAGRVSQNEITVLLRDTSGPETLVIYTLKS